MAVKKKKPYNLASKIIVALRAIHRNWPEANACLKNARIEGSKKHSCARCASEFRKEYMRKDHINQIGRQPCLVNGVWVPTWDSYINTFFSPLSNYQALCVDCHDVKSAEDKKRQKEVK